MRPRSTTARIPSREGSQFDCHVTTSDRAGQVPAVVIASSIRGVDEAIISIARDFASRGFIAAAPDLFWRSLPGPLLPDDPRAVERAQPRLAKIRAGEADIADTRIAMSKWPGFNGHAVVMGLCYGGPYAILGPERLGFDGGIACHGTQMLDFLGGIEEIAKPVALLWGDRDFAAPPEVIDAYRSAASRNRNIELKVFPGVAHDYMRRSNSQAFDADKYHLSLDVAVAMLRKLE
jgi:carboxymethylenebutenolidase